MSQTSSSSTESSSDVTASPQESSNGHASNGLSVSTQPAKNGSHQYSLSESDLIADDRTNEDIFETDISEEVYEQNYQYGTDDRVPDTWYRNARAMASVEDDPAVWTQRFYQLLSGQGLDTGPFPFTPGGRIFANAGTGLGKATLINCLAGETLVLTDQGRKPIEELAGSTATLLTRNGKWVEAPVNSYGEQPLRKVTLSRNGQERVLYATPNHRWYVGTKATTGYEVVETDDLESYHRLERVHSRRHTSVSPSPVGIARGFTFGDGSLVSTSPGAAANVNLVGEKDDSLETYFAPFARSEYDYSTGVTRYRGLPDAWKTTPVDLDENSATLYGWAAGYFAADGCVSENGEVIMDSCTREHIEHFIDVIEVLGIDHYGLKTQDRTSNLTGEDSTRYYVRLNPTSLREEFFVLDEHRIRFSEHGDRSLTYHWNVESVEETDRHETVYCAEVPEEKAFALDNGILTGNCFVSGFQGYDQDSMDEIQAELSRQAKILASEGGYGFCAHVMRPRGARIGGVGSMTPGAVQMLDVWNKQAATIVAGSGMKSDRDDVKDKIRKGAQMVTMGIWHPDVIEFIEAKQEPGRLHKFNMSVLVNDAFMEAVRNDDKWALRFPDYENEKEFYKEHWDGNLKAYQEKGGTVKTWRDPATGEPAVYEAREIWDKIMNSTYERNEPGVIFVDTINKENNLNYVEHINATNPCGEQVLPVGGVCLLGNLNVTQLVDKEKGQIDYDLVDDLVPRAVRFLDNVNDISYVPLEEQQRNLQQKRRIGLGHYGDGSALMMMKTRYGSEEGARVMREFQEHLANRAYQASARLAEEKGAFPLFDKDEYLSSPFVQRLSEETREMIGDLGLRNSHLLSIQPTGNTSTLGNAPSSGIEPVFMHSYIRTSEQPALPEDVNRPAMSPTAYEVGQDIDADGTAWVAEEQGDETVLRCQEDGHTHWQIHPTRGICKDQEVKDYAVRHMEDDGTWDPDADWAVTTRDLTVDDHLTQMKALAPFVDSSMSKCVVKGTRIQTSRGPVKVEAFFEGEQIPDSFSEPALDAKVSDGRGNMQPITKAYYGGEKRCVEVRVNTGESIRCSRNHKLLTPSGWKRASDLEAGERVAINHSVVETDAPLQKISQPDFTNCISRSFPTHLTERFARFLGMWFADGSVNVNSVQIHEKNAEVQERTTQLFEELFGDCKTRTDARTGVRTHEIHSCPIAQYFEAHYGEGCQSKSPPEALFRSPKGVKKAFLEGLTLDGYVDTTQSERLTVYEGYSKALRDAAAQLLSELGIRVHLRSKEVSGTSANTTFSVQAYLQDSLLTPVESHKREYSTRAFGAKERLVEDPGHHMDLPGTKDENYVRLRNLRRSLRKSPVVQQSALDALGVNYDDTLGWTKTTEIRDIGRQPVYDIEVADTHSYRVGNIVSHNTVNVPNDYPFEDFKELYKKAHATGVIKGVTTYRAGTMSAVLSGDDADEEDGVPRTEAPDRPDTLPCAIHRVRYRGDHWTILVGFLDDDPYEVFAFQSEGETPLFDDYSERIDEGHIRKNESRHYSLLGPNGEVVIDDITSHMPSDGVREETRLVSTALRHGSKIGFLVEQLEKAEGSIASFGQSMAKALQAHATDHEVTCDKCGSSNVRHVEGCMECADCGHSRCS